MRAPVRASPASVITPIIEPIAPTAKTPFDAPRPNTTLLNTHSEPTLGTIASAANATAEATHPATAHCRNVPNRCATSAAVNIHGLPLILTA